jgi:transcriptional regulator with XRE-family HTH domain
VSERAAVRVRTGGATLRGRELGARLRELRAAAGLTGEHVAARMGRAHSTLSRWENGGLTPRPPDVAFMLELYGIQGAEREALLRSAHGAREREDWELDASVKVADYVRMEGRAWKVETFHNGAVPGLLQTPAYAREIVRAWDPGATQLQVERWVGVRIARQERLTGDDPLQLSAVIAEGALRVAVGGAAVMRAQLKRLVDVAAQPNVELRVLPFAAGAHGSMTGTFTILRLRDEQDVATIATRGGDVYYEDVEPFAQALRRLTAVAVPHRKSVAMIAAMRRDFDTSKRPTDVPDLSSEAWRKSSHSQSENDCVEAAFLRDGGVAIRHSKDPGGSVLRYTCREWEAFLKGAKGGEFDLS